MVQGSAASAAPQQSAKPDVKVSAKKVDKSLFAKKGFSTQGSGSSGGRSGDIDLAGKDDILAVGVNPGNLYVYPNKGFNAASPLATYGPAVTINFNWGGQKWVGQGKVNGDAFPDVLGIDGSDNLYSHKHSGTFAGTSTLNGAQLISTGWGINNLVFLFDVDNDGIDDVVARKAGTEEFYAYLTTVQNGVITQAPAKPLISFETSSPIIDAVMADFTGDGVADFVVRLQNGGVLVYDITVGAEGEDYLISYGWTGMNAFTISDVNSDGKPDILGRVAANGDLNLYPHTGTWAPAADGTAFGTLGPIKVVGHQWHINRIIT
ncbi:hypothetical protein AOZ06_00895 [Kibdelosporangium phytohabitans]|uniref:VCBS repeat-containing protein n=2 Tax=Kibdelosporangium phytohabitans TaxID=860235 RepID=A0A0N9HUM7_9PSEU|nr:VCBS repeat-containing protein [Kibdelosporangium phytohabitans]ALG05676.1 hypothetical protein AOZ06_00895 [Kibdelosporangium phytohabitans]